MGRESGGEEPPRERTVMLVGLERAFGAACADLLAGDGLRVALVQHQQAVSEQMLIVRPDIVGVPEDIDEGTRSSLVASALSVGAEVIVLELGSSAARAATLLKAAISDLSRRQELP